MIGSRLNVFTLKICTLLRNFKSKVDNHFDFVHILYMYVYIYFIGFDNIYHYLIFTMSLCFIESNKTILSLNVFIVLEPIVNIIFFNKI